MTTVQIERGLMASNGPKVAIGDDRPNDESGCGKDQGRLQFRLSQNLTHKAVHRPARRQKNSYRDCNSRSSCRLAHCKPAQGQRQNERNFGGKAWVITPTAEIGYRCQSDYPRHGHAEENLAAQCSSRLRRAPP